MRQGLGSQVLFKFRPDFLTQALPGFARELLRDGFGHFIGMRMGSVADKSNLFPITTAPLAQHEVKAKPQALPER